MQAGAPDLDQLARSLTLVLDGGLASGVLDADPAAATAARQTAAQIVSASLGTPAASTDRQGPFWRLKTAPAASQLH